MPPRLPVRDFDWADVHARQHGKLVPDRPPLPASGSYAAPLFDQHAVSWCGCCYIVAAVQCVEDRGNIAVARATGRRVPRVVPDMQAVLDHFQDPVLGIDWNVCHGGHADRVAACLATGACPLLHDTRAWHAHPTRPAPRCPRSTVPYRVVAARHLPHAEVAAALLRDGPLVLDLNARTAKTLDAEGVVADLTPRSANHVVSVVGWRTHPHHGPVWIVRNSWGQKRVPKSLPDDLGCVTWDANACIVEWDRWIGDPRRPGFFYLPMSYAPLEAAESPWLAIEVMAVPGTGE